MHSEQVLLGECDSHRRGNPDRIKADETLHAMLRAQIIDPRGTTTEQLATKYEVHAYLDASHVTEYEISVEDSAELLSIQQVIRWCDTQLAEVDHYEIYVILGARSIEDSRPLVRVH